MRHTNIVASYLLLFRDGQVLLSRRHQTGYHDGEYSVIAGHVEAGETFTQTLIREAKEEAGITLRPDQIKMAHLMHRKSDNDDSERVHVYFLAKQWRGQLRNCEPEKCSELKWFPLNALPRDMVPCVRQAIQCVVKKQFYSEFGWE